MGLFKPSIEKLAQKSDVRGSTKVLLYEMDPNMRKDAVEASGKIENLQVYHF